MANTNRSPKELRDLVDRSKREADITEIEQTMQKLRNLTEDDKTETGFLRARIEEQSRLIMILKQRGDDFIRKNMSLEKLNKELLEDNEQRQYDFTNLTKKCELLNTRFNDLAENHHEMIKIKDEYKSNNQLLREENDKLQSILNNYTKNEYSKEKKYLEEIAILNDLCMKQGNEIDMLKDSLKKTKIESENEIKKLDNETRKRVTHLENELSSSKKDNDALEKLVKQYEHDLTNMMNTCDDKLKDIRKERDELIELNVQRAKIIQEKQAENQKLTRRIAELEKHIDNLNEKIELECEKVNTNSVIQKLKRELSEMEMKKNEISMEYESFKKHSLSLLEREKELNSKLRFLVH